MRIEVRAKVDTGWKSRSLTVKTDETKEKIFEDLTNTLSECDVVVEGNIVQLDIPRATLLVKDGEESVSTTLYGVEVNEAFDLASEAINNMNL